ncbi:hypothetical protein P4O66_001944 [Electrophorus voltai]|uniref:Uncharacterized protein n=1 Tax=Electrophorus voltai TaxID=2609070 RepID=A0AAD8ZWZ8_9TELE|nr:hypothetical protein P4O66_001944 [Electrophorus voltai]
MWTDYPLGQNHWPTFLSHDRLSACPLTKKHYDDLADNDGGEDEGPRTLDGFQEAPTAPSLGLASSTPDSRWFHFELEWLRTL